MRRPGQRIDHRQRDEPVGRGEQPEIRQLEHPEAARYGQRRHRNSRPARSRGAKTTSAVRGHDGRRLGVLRPCQEQVPQSVEARGRKGEGKGGCRHPPRYALARMSVRAVVFDFNGTLSDDEPILLRIYQELFAEHGRP